MPGSSYSLNIYHFQIFPYSRLAHLHLHQTALGSLIVRSLFIGSYQLNQFLLARMRSKSSNRAPKCRSSSSAQSGSLCLFQLIKNCRCTRRKCVLRQESHRQSLTIQIIKAIFQLNHIIQVDPIRLRQSECVGRTIREGSHSFQLRYVYHRKQPVMFADDF